MIGKLMLLCKQSNQVCKTMVSKRCVDAMHKASPFTNAALVSPTRTLISMGVEMRTIGLTPNSLLRFKVAASREQEPTHVTPAQYIAMRMDAGVGVTDATMPRPEETSEVMRATMAKLGRLNPKMWARAATHPSKSEHDAKRKSVAAQSQKMLRMSNNQIASQIHNHIVSSVGVC